MFFFETIALTKLKYSVKDKLGIDEQLNLLKVNKPLRQIILEDGPFPKIIDKLVVRSENDLLFKNRIFSGRLSILINDKEFSSIRPLKSTLLQNRSAPKLFNLIKFCKDLRFELGYQQTSEYNDLNDYLDVADFIPNLKIVKNTHIRLVKRGYFEVLASKLSPVHLFKITFVSWFDREAVEVKRRFLHRIGTNCTEIDLGNAGELAFEAFRWTRATFIHYRYNGSFDIWDLQGGLGLFLRHGLPSVQPNAELLVTHCPYDPDDINEEMLQKGLTEIENHSFIGRIMIHGLIQRSGYEFEDKHQIRIYRLSVSPSLKTYFAMDSGLFFAKNMAF